MTAVRGVHASIHSLDELAVAGDAPSATVTKDGVRETTGEMTEKWVGTREAYQLLSRGDQTRLEIIIDTDEVFENMFNDAWPQVLEKIKNLVDRS